MRITESDFVCSCRLEDRVKDVTISVQQIIISSVEGTLPELSLYMRQEEVSEYAAVLSLPNQTGIQHHSFSHSIPANAIPDEYQFYSICWCKDHCQENPRIFITLISD